MTRMTHKEWLALGERLFGPLRIEWRFVCPACGYVQTPNDFRPFKGMGATPNTAYFNCIGRYDGDESVSMGVAPGPCNYTSGGLFDLRPVVIEMPDGTEMKAFAFEAAK